MHRNDRALCQVPGCHRRAARAVEIDLPGAWEATQRYTTLTVSVGLCCKHGHDVARRVQAILHARCEFYDLLSIIEQAVRFEKALQLRLEAANDEADRTELENGALREQLEEAKAGCRRAEIDAANERRPKQRQPAPAGDL